MDSPELDKQMKLEAFKGKTSRDVPQNYHGPILDSEFQIWQQETISCYLAKDIAGLKAVMPYIIRKEYTPESKDALGREKDLQPVGKFLKEHCPGKTVYDLCCGLPEYSRAPRDMAEVFDAKEYVGVDLFIHDKDDDKHTRQRKKKEALLEKGPEIKIEQQGKMPIFWVEDEMLAFLSRLKESNGSIFYFSGIEGMPGDPNTREYVQHLETELKRICKKGDIIMMDDLVSNIYLDMKKIGFEAMSFDQNDLKTRTYIKK